jgi:ribonucleotide reductase beta subunit family protein with ferritin-like domain
MGECPPLRYITNIFLTTVGTATPPGGKMGEWSPFQWIDAINKINKVGII